MLGCPRVLDWRWGRGSFGTLLLAAMTARAVARFMLVCSRWPVRMGSYGGSFFFFSSRRRHTRFDCDWSSDVCSSDLDGADVHERHRRPLHGAEPEPLRVGKPGPPWPGLAEGPDGRHLGHSPGVDDAQIGRASCRERV